LVVLHRGYNYLKQDGSVGGIFYPEKNQVRWHGGGANPQAGAELGTQY
jgi:hypothetical protein